MFGDKLPLVVFRVFARLSAQSYWFLLPAHQVWMAGSARMGPGSHFAPRCPLTGVFFFVSSSKSTESLLSTPGQLQYEQRGINALRSLPSRVGRRCSCYRESHSRATVHAVYFHPAFSDELVAFMSESVVRILTFSSEVPLVEFFREPCIPDFFGQ